MWDFAQGNQVLGDGSKEGESFSSVTAATLIIYIGSPIQFFSHHVLHGSNSNIVLSFSCTAPFAAIDKVNYMFY